MLVLKVENGPLWIALANFASARPSFSSDEVAAINERFRQFNLDIRRIRRINTRNGGVYFRVTCPRMIWFRDDWVNYLLQAPAEPVDIMSYFAGSPGNNNSTPPSEDGA